jgi:ketosteroid isomerase-like protein
MEWHAAQIVSVRDGKIARIDNYEDRAEALEAVGLREEAGGSRAP